jgi:adenylate cyclase
MVREGAPVSEVRKIAAILVADVVGYSRLAGADEDLTLSRLRALRSDLIDPAVAVHHGRIVKRTGDGLIAEFRSVVEAVRCAIAMQNGLIERNVGVADDRRIDFRIGVHLGDVVEEADGDLMGDGVNIAARLEGIAKPGAICLSEDAYRQVKGRLDLAASDLGLTQLKNIAEPIRVYSLQVGVPAQAKAATEPLENPLKPKRRSAFLPLIAGIVALIVIVGGAWYFLAGNRTAPVAATASAPAEPAHLSIVVLPFTNLSGDPAQDYFADGITENLTTDLSRIRDSFVIARNTAFTFKGKSIDAKEIGKELGVRYVLEGSVQRDGTRVRVNAQLIDAEAGAHLWADRFEEDVADLFKLQDQVVARLANALNYELVRAEAETGARSKNPDVIDLDMRGHEALWRWFQQPTKDSLIAIRALFEQALKIDPNDADALGDDAVTYLNDYAFGWANPETDYEAKVLGQVDRAIALAPRNPWNYSTKSVYLTLTGHPNEGLRVADEALAINPNYAAEYAYRSIAELRLHQFAEAKSGLQQAMRLSPRDPRMGPWHDWTAEAELGLGHFDAAI